MTPPAAAPAVRARTLAPPRRLVPAPAPRPRRVSGPARPARLRQPAAAPARSERGLLLGVLELAQGVFSHRLIDRLIRGRAWIAIVVFALLGIVTLQLTLLKLNAGIGRSLERAALLQRENAALSIENSELAAGSRIEAAAEHLGMSLVPAGSLKFLTARPGGDLSKAAGVMSAPVSSAASESSGVPPASASSSQSGSSGEPSAVGETTATSGPTEGETTATTSSSEREASPEAPQVRPEATPASREAAPLQASSEREAPSTTAGPSEAGPAGGTQAGPTG